MKFFNFAHHMKILFTCLGNICRSPIAEAVLRKKITENGLPWEVASNGTNRFHKGDPADSRTISVCAKNGIDIRSHIARRFKTTDFEQYDRIICMADDVYEELQQFVTQPNQLQKVEIHSFNDPWYGGAEGFDACFNAIDSFCDKMIVASQE